MSLLQADMVLGLHCGYVALSSLWVYDFILCIPDSVAYLVESQWGLSTWPYLACRHLPFAFVLLNMLSIFHPDALPSLCRSYLIANTWYLIIFCAECIFVLRANVVWENKLMVFTIISIIAYLVPITICFQEIISSTSGESWIPGTVGYLDKAAKSRLILVFSLLVVAELEILLFLLYRAVGNYGWRIGNRLMRGLILHNMQYFSCSFVFSLSVILAIVFLPFPVAHIVAEFQVVLQTILVTRMHTNFWKSDGAPCDIYRQSLTTFMAVVPDLI
ncbi:hypothetical protein K503DRAFT_52668 [Rhizopogon vinicolor AM-OR11-026]|uniref:DUF6533 domain-containing protein n=1 Tax=Rhizopogon vinicolor AM-OR11-026 TaxID=1314800 RepID=A0A1B7MGM3_9AGAM|nr:hypothetical protein K503DRAFT_52668 [Rhizopogon vinicolor AM-OR11-026]